MADTERPIKIYRGRRCWEKMNLNSIALTFAKIGFIAPLLVPLRLSLFLPIGLDE
jgi:hypothetical protein